MLDKLDRNRVSINSPSYAATSFVPFRINPRYAIDDYESSHVVAHGPPALDHASFAIGSSFFSEPGHRIFERLACLGLDLITGTDTIVFFAETIRSMCR